MAHSTKERDIIEIDHQRHDADTGPKKGAFSIETIFWMIVLFLFNVHLITGSSNDHLVFRPHDLLSGEWYRILTFSFVHGSWYHFLLDAGAFLILYTGLAEKRALPKLLYVAAGGAFSLLFSVMFSENLNTLGLCGLSGIAHGLMAVSALEMITGRDTSQTKAGIICLATVCLKSLYEAVTGNMMFSFFHLPLYGTPVAVSHLGGVVGGIFCFFLSNLSHRVRFQRSTFSNNSNKILDF